MGFRGRRFGLRLTVMKYNPNSGPAHAAAHE